MASRRSYEDDVNKVSISIFITNFPNQFYAKDLWRVCNQYRKVIDAVIPNRRTKLGKRFGFVRFIKVLDVDRLVNNICTIWVERFKLHTNLARCQRTSLNNNHSQHLNKAEKKVVLVIGNKDNESNGHTNSYIHTVKRGTQFHNIVDDNKPAIVLDESRLNQKDYSTAVMGKVKEFSKVFWIRAKEVSSWVPDFVEDEEEDSDSEDGSIEEGPYSKNVDKQEEREWCNSEDPFNIYGLLNKKLKNLNDNPKSNDTMKYPPGFTPLTNADSQSNDLKGVGKESDETLKNDQEEKQNSKVRKPSSINNSKEDRGNPYVLVTFKKNDKPHSGGSMLQFLEDLVKVGQAMGYNMEGCLAQKAKKDWVKELCVTNKVNFLSLQETKMEMVEEFNIKSCWGNFTFDYVYSPSVDYSGELSKKKLLWDYLIFVIDNWNGDVVIMGDFNEVRTPAERYGSIFNVQGANAFNSFISSTGLEKVLSGGCSFAWCHKSANKMSKLDRFLISEEKIRAWIKIKMENSYIQKKNLKADLAEIDLLLDIGEEDSDILNKRVYVSKSLQDIEKLESMEVAQKAKIKWAIEGDENSKYYHDILNKKRSHLAVRGILINGTWIDSPCLVKNKFLSHFKSRFNQPGVSRLHLNIKFHNKLTMDQKTDLECDITQDEIKRAIWDCEIDKSPGLDGFSFGFYRRYWNLLKKDVEQDYLDDVLKNFDFGDKWRAWIQNCLKSLRGSVIVDGSTTNEFQFCRGLKQGDPLSLFLFLLIMESLHISVQRVVDANMFRGISIGTSIQLSHLFYADDTVFMGQWSDSNIKTIVHVLLEFFHRASSLRINMNKSEIIGISVTKSIVE
nr:RNA-directed DNA polymerase, eukaryota, reverse transcriptase zinc-binding domain protein [Tanacetum cinerariifolium]